MKRIIYQSACLAIGVSLVAGCTPVPQSIRVLAADLPARADGQYAFIDDDDVKKGLVMKDALFQCKIDTEDGVQPSAACSCAESDTADWRADCKGWLGAHTPPAPTAAPPPPAAPSPPAPGAPPAPNVAPPNAPTGNP